MPLRAPTAGPARPPRLTWGTAALLVLAGIATLLVVLGPAAPPQAGLIAQALAVGGIWLVAGLAIRLASEHEALRSSRAELRAAAGTSNRTEAQLREQEARLRSIIDTVPESLITIG
jgi:hypothetical protein